MASSKKGLRSVKVISITEKKRRKSDLVVMWHSLIQVTMQILLKIHLFLHELWEYTRIWIWHDEIYVIREFLKQYLHYVPDDFSNSWRDGKLLCILLNKLQPGCIPEADNLDPNYGLRNMYHAFDVLETRFGITPTASVEQLVVCIDGSDFKLLEILSQLKKESEEQTRIPKIKIETDESNYDKEIYFPDTTKCIANGTGLMAAFVKHTAKFLISCPSISDVNIVIEIRGPLNTICRERITKRSPKKKISTTHFEQKSHQSLLRSISYTEMTNSNKDIDELDGNEKNLIPLEYDIYLNQISVDYTPLIEGKHIISILWHGQHVSDSPYVVPVEPTVEIHSIYSSKQLKPSFKLQSKFEDIKNKEREKVMIKVQEPVDKIGSIGKVISRKILRHIVKIKGKDIVVDSNDIDHLAAALLKMDYNCQTDPSRSRRNSWGFAGDAERKISAIRQFCIPPHEMEAQHMKLQNRSHSLTMNLNSKPPLKRSNSFENESILRQTQLETVSEGSVSSFVHYQSDDKDQDEKVFAYLDEEFQNEKESSEYKQFKYPIDGKVFCNSVSTEDPEENLSAPLNMSSKSIDGLLQSLLEKNTEKIISNDLNALYSELPRDDLTRASEFSGRQVEENKSISCPDISELDKNEIESNSKLLNMYQVDNPKLLCVNNELEHSNTQNKLCNEDKTLFFKNEGEEINNEIQDSNEIRFEMKLEESIKSSTNKVKRLPMYKCPRKNYYSRSKMYHQFDNGNKKRCNIYNKIENNYRRSRICYETKNKSKKVDRKTNNNDSFRFHRNQKNTEDLELRADLEINKSDQYKENAIFSNEKNNFQRSVSKFQFCYQNDGFDNYATQPSNDETVPLYLKPVSPKVTKKETLQQLIKSDRIIQKIPKKTIDLTNNTTFNSKDNSPHSITPTRQWNVDKKDDKFCLQEHNMLSLGQFNFKQFNPCFENSKGSLIKNKIKKLESAMTKDFHKNKASKTTSRNSLSTEMIDIKSKLTFWENVYRKDTQIKTENNSEIGTFLTQTNILKKKNFPVDSTNTHCTEVEDTESETKSNALPSISISQSLNHSFTLNNEENNSCWIKYTENKLCANLNSKLGLKRRFSDPGVANIKNRDTVLAAQCSGTVLSKMYHTSSTDNLSSSVDADYLESSFDDYFSSADAIISTEDEYIDDEIPGNSLLTHWGDLSLMKNLKTANISAYKEYCHYIDSEILKNQSQSAKSCPSECKVFGIGTYYGYVAVKNRFQVLTKGAGYGNLSASVQGFGKHDVSYVSVKYKRKDIYEVTYQVMRPGLYLISLRWMENPIVGSPFLCKITF